MPDLDLLAFLGGLLLTPGPTNLLLAVSTASSGWRRTASMLGAVVLAYLAVMAVVAALAALIPPDSTYQVVTGDIPVRDATGWTKPYIGNYAAYFLLPRRPSDSAPWVLCYGCHRDTLGGPSRVVWTNGGGLSLLRVDR